MTKEEVKAIIAKEIKLQQGFKNSHGVDLAKCLIEPVREKYLDAADNSTNEFWTVLEETPDRNGYKIFFDEKIKSFGLGIKSGKKELVSIGYYGSFLNTLESM